MWIAKKEIDSYNCFQSFTNNAINLFSKSNQVEFLCLKEYKILLWQAIDGSVFNTLPVALVVKSDHATTFPSSWKQENVKSYISLSVNTRSHMCSWLRSPKNDSLGVKSDPIASCSSAITNKPPLGIVWKRCNGVLALK